MAEIVQRMGDSESSLGEKLILIETIQMAVVQLSNSSGSEKNIETSYLNQLK